MAQMQRSLAAWWAQLAPGGRIVAPLRWSGQACNVAFNLDSDRLWPESAKACGGRGSGVAEYGECGVEQGRA